jgi:hypothetical protein
MERHVAIGRRDRPPVWLRDGVKTPPYSHAARLEAGYLLRLLQEGESLGLLHSRLMPVIGLWCHRLRINDEAGTSRIVHWADTDAVAILVCLRRRRNRRLHRSLRPADGGFESMTG